LEWRRHGAFVRESEGRAGGERQANGEAGDARAYSIGAARGEAGCHRPGASAGAAQADDDASTATRLGGGGRGDARRLARAGAVITRGDAVGGDERRGAREAAAWHARRARP
jgi:hypothetical protein